MGASDSKDVSKSSAVDDVDNAIMIDERCRQSFLLLSNGNDYIEFDQFKDKFGYNFGWKLWTHTTSGTNEKYRLQISEFSCSFSRLFENSENLLEVLKTPESILTLCACASGVEINLDDYPRLFDDLITKMESFSCLSDLLQWKDQNCPSLCDGLHAKFLSAFGTNLKTYASVCTSEILSPFQLWFLQCSLPPLYFIELNSDVEQMKDGSNKWSRLYSSISEGLSATMFQAKTRNYRGATVTVIQFDDNSVYVIALDQEWRNSASSFGLSDTLLYQLSPVFVRLAKPKGVYCNLKLKTCAMKISFDKYLEVDANFNGVSEIEVFGCANAGVEHLQSDLKAREAKQIEKNKRVLNPGLWDENPDKMLLNLVAGARSRE